MPYEHLNEIMEEFNDLHKKMRKLTSQHCRTLTMEQGKLLFLIDENKMNQKQIAASLHISEATLSVRIQRLVDSGLVNREVDSHDKRHHKITLSQHGKEMMNQMKHDFDYVYHIICRNMTEDDFEAIMKVIKKMKSNVEEELQ